MGCINVRVTNICSFTKKARHMCLDQWELKCSLGRTWHNADYLRFSDSRWGPTHISHKKIFKPQILVLIMRNFLCLIFVGGQVKVLLQKRHFERSSKNSERFCHIDVLGVIFESSFFSRLKTEQTVWNVCKPLVFLRIIHSQRVLPQPFLIVHMHLHYASHQIILTYNALWCYNIRPHGDLSVGDFDHNSSCLVQRDTLQTLELTEEQCVGLDPRAYSITDQTASFNHYPAGLLSVFARLDEHHQPSIKHKSRKRDIWSQIRNEGLCVVLKTTTLGWKLQSLQNHL